MSAPDDDAALAVLYNADCAVCRFEVDHHRRTADAQGVDIVFDDLNGSALAGWGVDADAAARRLHARTAQGVVSGWDANLAMWRAMPRWRLAARIGSWPVVRPVAEFVYERIFAPILYRRHLRRKGG